LRELRARLAKIEDAEDLRQSLDKRREAKFKESADLLKAKKLEDELNARLGKAADPLPRRSASPPTPARRAVPLSPPADMESYVDELNARIKHLEDERAKAADPNRSGAKKVDVRELEMKLREVEAERAKVASRASGAGDRMADLEARMERIEATLQKLLVETQRLRK
jgi:chromosome segregation ATPase